MNTGALGSPRVLLRDLALLAALPAALALLHLFLPPSVHDALVFVHADPSPVTAWTAAFVHLDDQHLVSNVVGYSAAVLPAYLLFAYRDRRRAFWVALLAFLAVVPLVASTASYLVYKHVFHVSETAVSRGFSGVVAACYGLLYAGTVGFVRELSDWRRAVNFGLAVLLLVLVGILFRGGALEPVVAAVAGVGVVLVGSDLVPRDAWREPRRVLGQMAREPGSVLLIGYCALVVVVMVPGLFPLNWVQGGQVSNVVAHGVGFGVGVLIETGLMVSRKGNCTNWD